MLNPLLPAATFLRSPDPTTVPLTSSSARISSLQAEGIAVLQAHPELRRTDRGHPSSDREIGGLTDRQRPSLAGDRGGDRANHGRERHDRRRSVDTRDECHIDRFGGVEIERYTPKDLGAGRDRLRLARARFRRRSRERGRHEADLGSRGPSSPDYPARRSSLVRARTACSSRCTQRRHDRSVHRTWQRPPCRKHQSHTACSPRSAVGATWLVLKSTHLLEPVRSVSGRPL